MVTPEIYEQAIRELSLHLAQSEIDRAMTAAKLTHAVRLLSRLLDEWPLEETPLPARGELQNLVVTLTS